LEALVHPFYDELRDPNTRLPNGRFLPPLFNFKVNGKELISDKHHVIVFSLIKFSVNMDVALLLYCRAQGSTCRDAGEAGSTSCKKAMCLVRVIMKQPCVVITIITIKYFLLPV